MGRAARVAACAALVVTACTAMPRVSGLRGIENVESGRDGVLQVFSARGIGSLDIEGRLPARICFRYGAGRPFPRLEGFGLVRRDDGGEHRVAVTLEGGCVEIPGARPPGRYRVEFVDYYR